nr:hypothetical protein [Tanacetum cinerariifolium]
FYNLAASAEDQRPAFISSPLPSVESVQSMKSEIRARAAALAPELSALRRHLHTNPELSFKETQTAAFVTKKLEELGLQPYAVAGTGVVALIEGQSGGPVVALRADMDALPIQELSDVPYKSQNPGVMHACGHDVHTTCLLGAAQLLTELKGQFKGTVKLIFQPGEELLPGGASLMIKDGVLENPMPTEVIGQHVFPRLPQIVSRRANPKMPSVLSFGKVIANGATNVIPDEVYIEGTFRTLDEAWRDEAHQHLRQLCEGLATSMGAVCELEIRRGYPCLDNNPSVTARELSSLLASGQVASAQTTTPTYDPTVAHRSIQALELWPELQGEVALRNGDYLLLALQGQRSTTDNYSNRTLGFDTRRIAHYLGGAEPGGQNWGRLRIDVERLFPLSSDIMGIALRPRLSYAASTHLRFQKPDNAANERTIQFTSLRSEIGVRFSPHVDITPWFAYQTVYRDDLIFYKDSANTIPSSGGKINNVYPTLGLDLRFTLIPTSPGANRRQLPSQH